MPVYYNDLWGLPMLLSDYIQIPSTLWSGIYATGSAVICDPPVTNTDKDFIICAINPGNLIEFLDHNGFKISHNDG